MDESAADDADADTDTEADTDSDVETDTTDTEFDRVRERAREALADEDLESVYVGLLSEDGQPAYFFGNDTEDAAQLREDAAVQLGMLVRVLADRSELSVEEVAELGREQAELMDTR